MSNMLELLKELEEKKINISLKDGNLQVNFDGEIDKEILNKLKLNKEKIINFLSKNLSANTGINNVKLSESYPISHAQKRIWMQSQNKKRSKAYHIYNQLNLVGDYDVHILELAIYEVIKRHEILRTIFKLNEEFEIKQWILDYDEFKFKVGHFDLRNENLPLEAVKSYIQKDNDIAFDLEKGPLLRTFFFQLSDTHYILYYNMHHIITDGWSMNILERDLLTIYEAIKSGAPHTLPDLRIQYKDYASWQLSAIEEGLYNNHKRFWIEHLSGELPRLDFPSFKTRPKLMTHDSRAMQTFLPLELTSRFKLLCTENNGSFFMGILTAIKILLNKYTEQQDIIIGTAVAGREDSDLEDQIGFYVNTLALRNQVDPNDSFLTFFEKIKKSTLSAFSHQIYPFNLLVEDLNLKIDTGRHPIFEMLFSFNNAASNDFCLDEIDTQTINDLGFSSCINDIEFHFQEYGDYLSFQINFNSDIYDCDVLKRFMVHYKMLLFELINRPDQDIKAIDYLTKQEKAQLLAEFNNTVSVYPKNKTIIDLFEDQAEKEPDNVALVFNDKKLTYKELNENANQLALYLRNNYAIKGDDLVGIELDRSDKFVIAVLAVLKSGGAYLPMDINYPEERLQYIQLESKTKVIIDEKLFIDHESTKENYSKNNLKNINTASDLAYVIYTSGTTGNPKGVMIEHKSLVNLCFWHKNNFSVTKEDRSGIYAGVAFDASVWEIFPYLINGAALYIIPNEIRLDVAAISKYFEENEITISFLPTQVAEKFMTLENNSLRFLLVGGDKLKFYNKRSYQVVNNYGPTENTVVATSIKIDTFVLKLSIGKPINNTEIYILSEHNKLSPLNVAGEICISGDGLARGYLNNPGLTAEKFIDNPFRPGTKMYKTGDSGRWLADGNIEFLGRKDHQVKIRGHRVELEEVENMMLQYSEKLRQLVIVTRENDCDKIMVAYFTADEFLDKSDLMNFMQQKLPDYMVPNFFVQLDVFPLTLNGKINIKSLPDISAADLIRKEYVAASNDVELKMVIIWQKILNRENIGVTDDFFELGGHSLKAVELIFLIQKEFDLNLDIYVFFENPTIQFLANYIHTMNFSDLDNIDSDSENDYLIF